MTTVNDIYNFIDSFAPFETALEFDNAGLLLGDKNQEVKGILIALDATDDVLNQAKKSESSLVITHHPIIFNPLKMLYSDSLPYKFAKSDVSVICAHTNLDKAEDGVGDCLANALELENIEMFDNSDEMGRIGTLAKPLSFTGFLEYVEEKLNTRVRITKTSKTINKVAVLGGGGDFAWSAAKSAGADAFVTGESKHHILLEASQGDFCFVDAGHYETEVLVCKSLKEKLNLNFKNIKIEIANQNSPIV